MTTFDRRDLADLAALQRQAGRAEVMPWFRNLGPGAVRNKTDALDPVTAADEAAEAMITAGLRDRFPGAVVVGEEATAADVSLLDRLGDADLAFVVDPIDGTANFAAGVPLFGVMAAALIRGEVVGAAIYDPVGDDWVLALRGQGAWRETPDGRQEALHVARAVPVEAMTGCVSWRFLPMAQRLTVCANLPRVAAVWGFRCAAHEYRTAAAGHLHFLMFNRMYPWDHAPGWLLHQEAGGYSAALDGSTYRTTRIEGGLIAAPDKASWQAVRDALLGDG
jgi:fructose-1,6-bisphosphatase/inositol monophosphatase family enzyme